MKLVKVLSVFAVIAAAGMVPAGCGSPAGGGNGYDEVVSAAASSPVFNSAGEEQSNDTSSSTTKTIKVKFEVKNGGWGLWKSFGIVSTAADSHLVYDRNLFANDYTITITAPENDPYLNIRWKGVEENLGKPRYTYCKAKMKVESGTITLDYNGVGKVATKNLYDVSVTTYSEQDWDEAEKRAVKY